MENRPENQLFENAQRIFDVAAAGTDDDFSDAQDFALLIRPDGGMHFVMDSPFSIEAAAAYAGAQTAFRVTRSREGIRVEGRSRSDSCLFEQRNAERSGQRLLADQPLYCISSPLLTSGTAS